MTQGLQTWQAERPDYVGEASLALSRADERGVEVRDPGIEARRDAAGTATVVRDYLAARRARSGILSFDIFADPAWDILLDLYASRLENRRVTITDASVAAGVPSTTGLRWVSRLVAGGAVMRSPDPIDRRRTYLTLSDEVARRLDDWVYVNLVPRRI